MTTNVKIDGSKIIDWNSFHDHFAEALGFPEFYGRNMDAWNDCMRVDFQWKLFTAGRMMPGDHRIEPWVVSNE